MTWECRLPLHSLQKCTASCAMLPLHAAHCSCSLAMPAVSLGQSRFTKGRYLGLSRYTLTQSDWELPWGCYADFTTSAAPVERARALTGITGLDPVKRLLGCRTLSAACSRVAPAWCAIAPRARAGTAANGTAGGASVCALAGTTPR